MLTHIWKRLGLKQYKNPKQLAHTTLYFNKQRTKSFR